MTNLLVRDGRLTLNMSSPNKRSHSPGASNNLPQKRTKISAQAQVIQPRKRRRGSKDPRMIALKKLEKRRRYPVFSGVPSHLDTLQSNQPTTRAIVPTTESQQFHQYSMSITVPEYPLSPPSNDYIGVDSNTPVRPNTETQSGSHTAASVL